MSFRRLVRTRGALARGMHTMSLIDVPIRFYGEKHAWPKRRRVIARALSPFLREGESLLDVGCGDGKLAAELCTQRPGHRIHGADTHLPPGAPPHIAAVRFDGFRLPFGDRAYDTCLLVDVLHHSRDPERLLREAARVARRAVVVKDHDYRSRLDFRLMQLGDCMGNRMFGVDLPYQFKRWHELEEMFRQAGLRIAQHDDALKPAGRLELHHHFVVRLVPARG